jgi:PAS domain S-box-containing protein
VVVDRAGVLMHVSDYAQELVGYSPDELLGSSAFELVHPRDRDLLRKTIEEVFGGRTVRNLQHRLLRRDGSDVYVETSATVVKDDEGNAILATVVTRDITERRKMENELRDSERRSTMMSQEAETRARELSDVVSIAAHELRHPATIFKAYSELLLSRRDDMGDEVVEQALESMDKASDRLIGLVETLLESSKIESQQMKLTLVESDPALLVSEAVDSFRAEGVTNEFRVEVSGQVVPARMDPEKVIRTLRLLVDNSIKFSPEAAAIGIQVRQSDHQTVFSVSDPGSGIPESSLERVFDRFYQVEDPVHHSKEGMGLGLNIARSMVEAHGGWIRAERRLPAGSVLSFGIPRNQSMPL